MTVDEIREFIELLMWKLHGVPYRWGGDDPMAGFDCSGGVQEIYRSVDLLPQGGDLNAQSIFSYLKNQGGKVIDVDGEFLKAGDAIFFGTSTLDIGHVGMAINDDLMFEFGGGDSRTTSVDAAIKQNAYGRFRPISRRRDLVAIIRPSKLCP